MTEINRGPGRPPKGDAPLTNAEHQKLHRERQRMEAQQRGNDIALDIDRLEKCLLKGMDFLNEIKRRHVEYMSSLKR